MIGFYYMHMSCVKLTECKYVLLILILNSANDNNNFYLICFSLNQIYKWVYIQLKRGTNQSILPLRNQQKWTKVTRWGKQFPKVWRRMGPWSCRAVAATTDSSHCGWRDGTSRTQVRLDSWREPRGANWESERTRAVAHAHVRMQVRRRSVHVRQTQKLKQQRGPGWEFWRRTAEALIQYFMAVQMRRCHAVGVMKPGVIWSVCRSSGCIDP